MNGLIPLLTPERINELAGIPAVASAVLIVTAAAVYLWGARSALRTLLGLVFVGLLFAPLPILVVVFGRRFFGEYPGYPLVAWGGYLFAVIIYTLVIVTIIRIRRRIPVPSIPIAEEHVTMSHVNPQPQAPAPTTLEKLAEYRKAIAAVLVPALTVLGASLIPDSSGLVEVTAAEWVAVVIAALGTGAAVAAVPNRAPSE